MCPGAPHTQLQKYKTSRCKSICIPLFITQGLHSFSKPPCQLSRDLWINVWPPGFAFLHKKAINWQESAKSAISFVHFLRSGGDSVLGCLKWIGFNYTGSDSLTPSSRYNILNTMHYWRSMSNDQTFSKAIYTCPSQTVNGVIISLYFI